MKFLKFIIEDFKSDIKFLIKLFKGEKIELNEKKLKELTTGWDTFIKDNWLFFLIITLSFLSGFWIASQHYQQTCNQFIYDNYIKKEVVENITQMMIKIN